MATGEARPLIVHVLYSLGAGGLENGLINILNRMPTECYRHAIVCLKQSGEFEARITADITVYSLNCKEGHDIGLYWRFWCLLRKLKPALVHTRNIAALEMQALVFLMPGVKGVHGEHGRDIYDVAGENTRYRYLRRAMSLFVDRFITVSQDLQAWLIDEVGIPARKIVQIYNGVDTVKFAPKPVSQIASPDTDSESAPVVHIGTVGRLAAIKDQASLLKAVHQLLQAQPALRNTISVTLVGDGPLLQELKLLAKELVLDDIVIMAGNRDDIPQLLQQLDLFVLPSLGEGVSNTVLEAMATGLPIIATAVGGNCELVSDGVNGLLTPVCDVNALADALGDLITDADKRQKMGQASLRLVKSGFSWARTVEQYKAVYDALLATPGDHARAGV
ncbi:TIGR03088 family PEP-CTERM/XrtA system glycosyltransferase [Halieaceae bacterium IMCC14734]|uniref:TIGR03088 family PEP-CTERM/XrtA system glycosyltransferase n=1 Tax=Candidatus Litorirhabdus singularis TaxID=2518993 RepID=A0ABT3TG56_9GAMM|nr:TIGR03088 family PEP-CTERM/XrtA system glycosyltransferase [Candidatus Litorirhabdus singularis]MCX2981292.1 TIGR03088 family PEP-CTERM/XrtA system glycosyltransferase [Candidatus Litorirhabdus singularis]